MDGYLVVRPFSGHKVGELMTPDQFADARRAAQLIDQRYITPAPTQASQPTVASLLGATIRQLRELAGSVKDACVIESALLQETRQQATEILTKRLEEIQPEEGAQQ